MWVFNRRLSNHVSTSIPLVVLRVEHHVSLDCLLRYGWMKFPGKKTVKWANLAGKLMANWLSQKVRQGMIFASSSTAEGELPIPFLCHADSAQCAIWGRFLTSSPAIPQYSTRGLRELSLLEVLFVPLDCRSVAWWSSIMELQHRMQWCRLFWCGFTMDMVFFCAFQLRLLNHEKRLKSLRLIFFQVGFVLKKQNFMVCSEGSVWLSMHPKVLRHVRLCAECPGQWREMQRDWVWQRFVLYMVENCSYL